jgi:organic hydroperoxide reductase OsmC/OhrA
MKIHHYTQAITWTGNRGEGTTNYAAYHRDYTIEIEGKAPQLGSADPAFRGDGTKINPEDMLLSAISSCHMLWFLHLCADAGITVVDYTDKPEAWMEENPGNGGKFIKVILNPIVSILESDRLEASIALHQLAGKKCFITNSCNFPVDYRPQHNQV